ncbi:MAG TPA: single-stranded DNA-binding protein [Pyrinomonadaceae bacterium]|nr:single-stranded DNA-binding protein [Pyrinomonadaceae bacterium]
MNNTTENTNNQPKANKTINGNESSSVLTVLSGRVTAPITIEESTAGKKFANFSIALNIVEKDNNGNKQPVTKFFTMTAWESVAEAMANNVGKGDLVKVRVAVKPHIYPSHKQQDMKTELKMTANRFKLITRARANQ